MKDKLAIGFMILLSVSLFLLCAGVGSVGRQTQKLTPGQQGVRSIFQNLEPDPKAIGRPWPIPDPPERWDNWQKKIYAGQPY